VQRIVGAAVDVKDVLVDTDVVVDTVLIVDADVAAAATHTSKQKLHAPWSALLAPPELPRKCMSTPTLSLPMRCVSKPTWSLPTTCT